MKTADWRTFHCAELAADAVNQASGRDIWAELGGVPRGWKQAADLYRRHGCRTLAQMVTKVLGAPLASPKLAMRGDIVMVQRALGVCRGDLAVCIGATHPMRQVELAWSARGRPLAGS